jgi:hypothetical protein
MIEWMENDEGPVKENTVADVRKETVYERPTSGESPSTDAVQPYKQPTTNLEKLSACLRGYYLYGADKKTLRSLQRWKDFEPQGPS